MVSVTSRCGVKMVAVVAAIVVAIQIALLDRLYCAVTAGLVTFFPLGDPYKDEP